MITGTDFVVVPTKDFARAVTFYGDTLELTPGIRYGDHPGAEFETGDLTLAVMDLEFFGGPACGPSGPIAFRVDDVAEARAALEHKGVVFTGDIVDSGVCHQAFFADPDGNPLILHHRYVPRTS
ncbi:MAG: VOC family protein [Baekduiaceae bacterium]